MRQQQQLQMFPPAQAKERKQDKAKQMTKRRRLANTALTMAKRPTARVGRQTESIHVGRLYDQILSETIAGGTMT